MNKKLSLQDIAMLVLIGGIIFIPFLGGVHLFDWDEINFAEAAREMLVSDNYLQMNIDFNAFYEKPPLFIWLQVISFKIFGANEFASRFPNALTGILTFLSIYIFSTKHVDKRLTFYWCTVLLASLLPHFYFRSGIIDPLFNLLIYFGLLSFIVHRESNSVKAASLSGVLVGLAILTKGPVGLLLPLLAIFFYSFFKGKDWFRIWIQAFAMTIVAICVAGIWFLVDYLTNGPEFTVEFIKYQIRLFTTEDAGHGGFLGYHFVIILLGCFPASLFALPSFRRRRIRNINPDIVLINKILFIVVLTVFTIVKTKIVHYSSLCYLPLTFLAALVIFKYERHLLRQRYLKAVFVLVGFLIGLVLLLLPNITRWESLLQKLTEKDLFAQSIIALESPWRWYDNLPGVLFLSAVCILFFSRKRSSILSSLYFFILAVSTSILIFPSRIEHYTQRTLITYIKKAAKEGKILYPVNHKSYAHLYYGQKMPDDYKPNRTEPIVKQNPRETLYLFSRVDRPIDVNAIPNLKEIDRKGGYIFYEMNGEN